MTAAPAPVGRPDQPRLTRPDGSPVRVLVVDGGRVVADDAPGPAVAHYRRLVDAGPG